MADMNREQMESLIKSQQIEIKNKSFMLENWTNIGNKLQLKIDQLEKQLERLMHIRHCRNCCNSELAERNGLLLCDSFYLVGILNCPFIGKDISDRDKICKRWA